MEIRHRQPVLCVVIYLRYACRISNRRLWDLRFCWATLQFVSQQGFTTGEPHHTQVLRKPIFIFKIFLFFHFGKDLSLWQTMVFALYCFLKKKLDLIDAVLPSLFNSFFEGIIFWFPVKCCCRERASLPVKLGIFHGKVLHNTGW